MDRHWCGLKPLSVLGCPDHYVAGAAATVKCYEHVKDAKYVALAIISKSNILGVLDMLAALRRCSSPCRVVIRTTKKPQNPYTIYRNKWRHQ